VPTEIGFITHELTEDNEGGRATGWLPGRLSAQGRHNAAHIPERTVCQGVNAIFTSDLARAVETVELAFPDSSVPVLKDWRLRECDYGRLNGSPSSLVHGDRSAYLHRPYPDGESWEGAVARVGRFLEDVPLRWQNQRVLVVGHVATRWAFERFLAGASLADLAAAEFGWQPGWEYLLP
jgi:2,3-bisphosphoglycerate-dependent phosphoglycerate mutase